MKLKKCVSLILSFVLVVGVVPMTAFAAPKEIYAPEIDEGIASESIADLIDPGMSEIQAARTPDQHWNLTASSYTAKLINLKASYGSYTLYYFSTASGIIHLDCNMLRSGTTETMGRAMKIELYEKDTPTSSGKLFLSRWIYFAKDENRTALFAGLDPNRFYYIRFYNGSGSSASSNRDISGTITIRGYYKK